MRVKEVSGHDILERPVATLTGVGKQLGQRLAKLGVHRLGDLLCLVPLRYEDRTRLQPMGSVRPGEKALIEGRVELSEVVARRRRSLLVRIEDGTGAVTLRFFHFPPTAAQRYPRGTLLRCFGEVRAGRTGLEMVHPEYHVVTSREDQPDAALTPTYSLTEGLGQQRLRRLVQQALDALRRESAPDHLAGHIPPDWPDLTEALESLHQPPPGCDPVALASGDYPWQKRLALEELVAQRLSLRFMTQDEGAGRAPVLLDPKGAVLDEFRQSLPFRLTAGQQTALADIVGDLRHDTPMHRLLQGDVGSGKTVLAAAAAVVASSAGFQTAIMAPTELLAEQHVANFKRWLEPLGISVTLLTGSMPVGGRREGIEAIQSGRAMVAVGTHALFQSAAKFARLALIVVDEQHRFGVEQRLQLRRKGEASACVPHQLVMTATPIPRTLAMTAYADLDCSIIRELPAGRQPVRTAVVPESRRPELVERIGVHCKAGRQAYWVCPLIEESEFIDSRAAAALEQELAEALPDIRIGLVHGRMKTADKEGVMRAFAARQIALLVATTVVEVGVDVPNASLMVIESAERMGLSQLHQLRGRVGRGDVESSCVLLYKRPLSKVAHERLDLMRRSGDGFEIAEKDLELRGPGEVLGTRQTGLMQLRVADLTRDADLLPEVVRVCDELVVQAPERVAPLLRRWIPGGSEFATV